MPTAHAVLSPSASERWLSCPASVRMVAALPQKPGGSIYAMEGTIAHALGELELSRELGKITDKEYVKRHRAWLREAQAAKITTEQTDDMAEHIARYVDVVMERKALYPMSQVLLEQRVDTGVPTCWGTSDTVIVSPTHVEIIDLKYGVGVAVQAEGNPQLRLYALGALDTFGDVLGETEIVRMTIFQPRIHSLTTAEMSAEDLRAWRTSILPIAEAALGDDAEFGPSEAACRFCPVAGQCRAQLEWATTRDFGEDVSLLSPAEISEALTLVPGVKAWLGALEETALRKAYSERVDLPGFKVVLSGGIRVIRDVENATDQLHALGFTDDDIMAAPKLKGIGDLERLSRQLPKVKPEGTARERWQKLEEMLGDAVGRTEGKPALVPEDDPRPPADPDSAAAKEFAAEHVPTEED